MEQEIINKYLEGKSISSLLKEYPTYNRRTLTKVLTDNHITIRGGRKKKTFSDEQVEEIKKMIKEGAFLKEIAAYFNIDTETMKRRLDELGLTITNTNRVNRRIKAIIFLIQIAPKKPIGQVSYILTVQQTIIEKLVEYDFSFKNKIKKYQKNLKKIYKQIVKSFMI